MTMSIQSRSRMAHIAKNIPDPRRKLLPSIAASPARLRTTGDRDLPAANSMSAVTSRYLAAPLDGIGTPVPFARGTQIYGECDSAKYLYMIVKGTVRTCRMTLDGHRRIVGFYFPGDLFGFETGDAHTLSAEAVSQTTVRMIRRSVMAASADQQERVAHFLCNTLYREIAREQEHIVRLGKPALERVADFLLEMTRRFPHPVTLELPMSRQDIADHLDITIETVSRTLRQLMKNAVLESIHGRRITLGSRSAMNRICERPSVGYRDGYARYLPSSGEPARSTRWKTLRPSGERSSS